jgi:hypothetical protein
MFITGNEIIIIINCKTIYFESAVRKKVNQ